MRACFGIAFLSATLVYAQPPPPQAYSEGSVPVTGESISSRLAGKVYSVKPADGHSSIAQDGQAEAFIRGIVAEQVVAWDAGDGTAYAKDLAPEASFTNLFGTVMYGAPAFAERHRQILATFYRGTTKRHAIRRIRFVTSDVAIVDIDNEIRGVKAMPAGIPVPSDGTVKTQLMEVFVRRGNRWWVEAYHNVDVKPAN